MADKTPSKADQLRAQREGRWAKNVSGKFANGPGREILATTKPSRAPGKRPRPALTKPQGESAVAPGEPKGAFDKGAYQRDLMRKRRAEERKTKFRVLAAELEGRDAVTIAAKLMKAFSRKTGRKP